MSEFMLDKLYDFQLCISIFRDVLICLVLIAIIFSDKLKR